VQELARKMDLDRNNRGERERWRDRHSQEFKNMIQFPNSGQKKERPDSKLQLYRLSQPHSFANQIVQFLYRKKYISFRIQSKVDCTELETNKSKFSRLERLVWEFSCLFFFFFFFLSLRQQTLDYNTATSTILDRDKEEDRSGV
jgi:hypothetical protein